MRKATLLFLALAAAFALQAQWVDDPINNNHIANSPDYCGEIFVSTDNENGDTYVQWTSSGSNGYGPTLQRLTFDGTPQWGDDGIRIMGHQFSSSSEGKAMAVTADHAVVSCFATAEDITVAVKINADGTYAWGERGVTLFDGRGFSRAEVIAGEDGGAWALGFDYQRLFLQYIKADGSLYPTTIVEAEGFICQYGQLTLGVGNAAFLTYEKTPASGSFWIDKEIHLVGYTVEGVQIGPDVTLMSSQTFQVTYIHYVVPDGLGGAYAYIWHSGIGGMFNTYVFHYDANGFSTISDTNGVAVHEPDANNYYLGAYGTVDPASHDLIIAYEQTDANFQAESRIYINRITSTGEKVWGEGLLAVDDIGDNYSDIFVDAFEDGSGFSLIYNKGNYNSTIEAIGFDMDGNQLWTKQISSSSYTRAMCDNSSGFHMGQNIIAWVNSGNGGIYGQNIAPDGTMGPIEPIIPTPDCPAPENLQGEYSFDMETQLFGVQISWTAPATQPLHYNLYRHNDINKDNLVIEVPGNATSYLDESGLGTYKYQLTAVYEDCESDFALTPDGEDHVYVEVTGIEENTENKIVTVVRIYNANGQCLRSQTPEDLGTGIYIIQGLTQDGQMVNQKIVVNKQP